MPPDKIKLLEELRSRPNNVRASELRKLMSIFDFESRDAKHCRLYKHKKYRFLIVTVTEHKEKGQENKIFERYIKKCIASIDEVIRMEKGEEDDVR
ncbi:MAG: hypothetical protein HZB85_08255 [Deltaproteobacteria bacterium]|nr:hypothetical protein [Deltaproteobacteria bacterium]